jgi:hypothetical protein
MLLRKSYLVHITNAINSIVRRTKPIRVVNTSILLYLTTMASKSIHAFLFTPAIIPPHYPYQRQNQQLTTSSFYSPKKALCSTAEDSFFSSCHNSADDSSNIPWVKYEMTPLPDSLIDTTIFVGNLGDFIAEDTLSRLFAQVSTLQTVPSAVARTPNNYSMGYGFVTFPSTEEMEVNTNLKKKTQARTTAAYIFSLNMFCFTFLYCFLRSFFLSFFFLLL